ncbi:MAG: hypothetical protein ACYSUM_07700 [Planctomycetota bacterium]
MILAGLVLGSVALAAAEAATKYDFEVVKVDEIYFGSGKHPKAPGVMTADDVWAVIPEYKQILEDELTDEDAQYHLLMRKAAERFSKALKKLAKRDSYDMLGEKGSIRALGKKKIPDVTREMIKLVTRD